MRKARHAHTGTLPGAVTVSSKGVTGGGWLNCVIDPFSDFQSLKQACSNGRGVSALVARQVAIKAPPPLHPIITIIEHGRRVPKRQQ